MSADPLPPPSKESPGRLSDIALWLAMGTVGAAMLFSAAVHMPQEIKRVGLFAVALGALAGWGLGQWAAVRKLHGSRVVVGLTWVLIVAGEVLAAVQTHRLGVNPDRSELKPEQFDHDMITEGMRQYFAQEPEDLTEEGRERWRRDREQFAEGERRREIELESRRLHRSFYGYLANRIPKKWGHWSYPWPAIFWGAEVLLGSTLGTWLAAWTMRNRPGERGAGTDR